ncbi:MAG TPA: ImmA/IrrE family metallo-endopeptidase [Candidatus Gastranaerophilales bacterium]|nr:ImmA/IrrE family metallo-endopeptidase [Candidatus Gastranaerophilales bacterium]
MTSNPYFFRDQNIINHSNKLLIETVGTDDLPINVFDIPEYLDINFEFTSEKFKSAKELGLTEIINDKFYIYLNANVFGNSIEEAKKDTTQWRRCRFTLAHELGHCFLPNHIDVNIQKNFQEDSVNSLKNSYLKQKEVEADGFASELLIPSKTVNKSFLDDSKNLFKNAKILSETYDVSLQVAIMQLISLSTANICVCVFSSPYNGKIISYKPADSFRYYGNGARIEVKTEVPQNSIAKKLLNGDLRQEGIPNTLDIYYWFPEFRGSDEAKLTECSVHFNHYILTYLEITDTSIYGY